ncbi:MAG: PQQ-binding-like beta-propeller repeat protein [Paracoccaceae bacterium]
MGKGAVKVGLNGVVTGLALLGLLAACEKEVILQGERFPLRASLEDSLPVEGEPAPVAPPLRPENQSVPISLPAPQAFADWSHRGGNARHASGHGVLSAAPQRVFSVNVGAGNSRGNRVSAAPVVSGAQVFTIDARALVSAVSTAGVLQWSVDLTADFDRGGNVSGGGLAVAGNRVYAATGYGELVALEAGSGAVVWRQRLDSPVTGAPMVEGDTVYVVGRDGAGWAIDAGNGRMRWQMAGTPSPTGMVSGSAPALAGDLVIFPYTSGQLTAARRDTGDPVWSAAVTGKRVGRAYAWTTDVTGDPVVTGPVTYVGTAAGRTAALDTETGQTIWSVGEGALNPPLVVGGSVFVVNDENRLVRMDDGTGEVIWAVDMPYWTSDKVRKRQGIAAQFGPVLAGGRLVVVGSDGQLRLFNPTDGALVGGAEIPGGAASSVALAGGVLYVVGGNGQLHAFR